MIKVGDRVTVISYNWPGTVEEIDYKEGTACVDMDKPEEFAVKKLNMTIDELRRALSSGKKPVVKMMHMDISDLRKISGSPEADWKDIWDESAI